VNDNELRRRLHGLRVPMASVAARERARHRAARALGRDTTGTDAPGNRFTWQWAGALAVLVAFVLVWHVRPRTSTPEEDVATDQRILQQMQTLFPRQVNAVVEDNGRVSLAIAQSPEVGSDQPVVVLFRQNGRTIRVLSYSGHKVCLPLGGEERCFEILATAAGGVIIEGADKVWLASGKPEIAGYSVQAQTLEASL